ncbi:hypothetical protein [Parasitella parasitica]|uniref:Uncharacterized protein n=1 Tax=Parasitella parasitica TaxID=35722 RepID=A0A0B7MP17_9FUNG|nr:hypothetical protein [Parasitella parasitica]
MTDFFNPEPIMLRDSTSLMAVEDEKELIEVIQHLAPEQFDYEFPPKSCIMAIEANEIGQEEFSFFDECSFTSNSTAAYSNILYEEEDYYDEADAVQNSEQLLDQYLNTFSNPDMSFVADHQLSPLQLPTQAASSECSRDRGESYDSTGTVMIRKSLQYARPSSFLSAHRQIQYLERVAEEDRINWDKSSFTFPEYSTSESENEKDYRSVHPYYRDRMESEADRFGSHYDDLASLSEDGQSSYSNHSKVVVMKISKFNLSPPTFIHCSQSTSSFTSSDEGYDDEGYEHKLIESASVFLPLSDQEQEYMLQFDDERREAATKIQSVWRGYIFRKKAALNSSSSLKVSHRVLAGLAHINDTIHRRNNNQLQERIYTLEKNLEEETAMRMAFEKATEDMTVLMDHQHQVLHQRVEQEVSMRQTYERKMDQVMAQVQPLESRLRHESKARADMEAMMSRVLDQLHELKMQSQEETERRKSLQRKLDAAAQEIALLKQQQKQPVRPSSRSTLASSSTQQLRSSSRLSSTSTTKRASPISPPKTPTSDIGSRRQITSSTTSRSTTSRLTPSTPQIRRTVINRKS